MGRSDRTDAAGVAELSEIAAEWGHSLREVFTPAGVLHFKTDCSLMDADTILSTSRLAVSGCFDGYRVLFVPDGEEPAANAIRFINLVLLAAVFPQTAEMLTKADMKWSRSTIRFVTNWTAECPAYLCGSDQILAGSLATQSFGKKPDEARYAV